jgi:hypothetical protein
MIENDYSPLPQQNKDEATQQQQQQQQCPYPPFPPATLLVLQQLENTQALNS